MPKRKVKRSYYESLYEVAAAVNTARTPEEVLGSIVEKVATALGAKGCSIMLLTPDGKRLLHTAAYGLSDWYIRKGRYLAEKSIAETLKGTAVSIMDAAIGLLPAFWAGVLCAAGSGLLGLSCAWRGRRNRRLAFARLLDGFIVCSLLICFVVIVNIVPAMLASAVDSGGSPVMVTLMAQGLASNVHRVVWPASLALVLLLVRGALALGSGASQGSA